MPSLWNLTQSVQLSLLSEAELSPLHFFSVAKAGANMQNRKAGARDGKRLSFVGHFLCFSFAFSSSAKGRGLSVFVCQSITCFMASDSGHNLISLEAGVFVEGSMEVNILVKWFLCLLSFFLPTSFALFVFWLLRGGGSVVMQREWSLFLTPMNNT